METNHGGRQQRFFVKGIDAENAKSKTIVVNDKDITVAEYFRSKYKIQLKYVLFISCQILLKLFLGRRWPR